MAQLDQQALRGSVVLRVRQELRGLQVIWGRQDLRGLQVLQDQQALRAQSVPRVLQEQTDLRVLRAHKGHKVIQVLREVMGQWVQRGQQDLRALLLRLQVLRALQVQVQQGQQVLHHRWRGRLARTARLVRKEIQAILVQQVLPGQLGLWGQLEHKAHKAHRGPKAQLAQQAQQVQQVHKVYKATQEQQV